MAGPKTIAHDVAAEILPLFLTLDPISPVPETHKPIK